MSLVTGSLVGASWGGEANLMNIFLWMNLPHSSCELQKNQNLGYFAENKWSVRSGGKNKTDVHVLLLVQSFLVVYFLSFVVELYVLHCQSCRNCSCSPPCLSWRSSSIRILSEWFSWNRVSCLINDRHATMWSEIALFYLNHVEKKCEIGSIPLPINDDWRWFCYFSLDEGRGTTRSR